ncbi:hypothetical protein JL100_017945 [Skermanella mucosa]|uniref:major capsid protein n=1 Tax=Skermanella mucosa TaxID=1789672 RepID=UPI00192B0B1B|nr:hypothetical protein [Skermanella mucosa]UEM18968.1 hypothetical protein JL100_017945 [Skermanella mucosa]
MAKMQTADLAYIVQNSAPYIREASVKKSVFFGSGVITPVPGLTIPKGGQVTIPNFGRIASTAQVLRDDQPLVTSKITTGKQVGVVVNRGDAWSVNDLVGAYAGEDFVGEIESQIGEYWSDQIDQHAVSVVKGVTGALAATNAHNISGLTGSDAVISNQSFNAALHRLGDARGKLAMVVAHSDVIQKLEDLSMLDNLTVSEMPDVQTIRKRPILETDSLTPTGGVYDMYIVSRGLLAFGEGLNLGDELESDRDILARDTVITSVRSYTIHPFGMSYGGTAIGTNGQTPTNADFATAGNWTRVFDPKNIGVVKFSFKLA